MGLDFATGLRAMLRQDFEVGLVGEMRDRETANIALRAGITGHLIFTTLHTADTVSAIIRLLNLGIENYVISSGVIAILSQRLVRQLCPKFAPQRQKLGCIPQSDCRHNSITHIDRTTQYCSGKGLFGQTGGQ